MTKEQYEKRRTSCCIPGIIMTICAGGAAQDWTQSWLVFCLLIIGTVLLIYGCYCWAKYKGRHGAFSLLGFLGLIGFLILSRLKDRWIETKL